MQCKNCINFKKNKNVSISEEFIGNVGTCGLSGSMCKLHDRCKNGNYEKK